ncbi:MAG: hypothetical protein ACOX4J_09680 [Anaerovoracaceae bacterium]
MTEACVLTKSNHPISIYSKIHSSQEKSFTSVNTITFEAMERAKALFGKATFVMDRGYDDNKMFLKLDSLEQDYVIRLTGTRLTNGCPPQNCETVEKAKSKCLYFTGASSIRHIYGL